MKNLNLKVVFAFLFLFISIFFLAMTDSINAEEVKAEATTIIIIDGNEDSADSTAIMGSVSESRNLGDWRKRASLSSRGGMIVNTAKRFIGVPYVWGGTTTSGFDCSGFIMNIYGRHGLNIKRLADEQYYGGKKLSKSELTAGDLVFFSTYAPGVSHVGIYIGDNKFIHASSSRGVTIDSLDSEYFKNAYVGACRYW